MNIIKWAEEYLLSNGFTVTDPPEHVRTTPWSSVARFITSALITCLRNATFRYSLKETDHIYTELQEACFGSWLEAELKNNLLKAMLLAKKIWPIYAVLGEYRLMISSNAEEFKSLDRRGRLTYGLKEFIAERIT